MTQKNRKTSEDLRLERLEKISAAIDGGLFDAVGRAGAVLVGFSVKMEAEEVLVTIRGVLAGRRQVCFVGAGDLGSALLKVVAAAESDKLRWREDKYFDNGSLEI